MHITCCTPIILQVHKQLPHGVCGNEVSYYNAPDLSLCVCLFPHRIGIGSRHFMPVEGLGGHFLRGVPFAYSCLAAKKRDSFVHSQRVDTPF